jgi:hypothetical protein
MNFEEKDLPGLFQSADSSSVREQKKYYDGIFWYLILLIIAALLRFLLTTIRIQYSKLFQRFYSC